MKAKQKKEKVFDLDINIEKTMLMHCRENERETPKG